MNEFERAKFYGVTIEELRALKELVKKYRGEGLDMKRPCKLGQNRIKS